MNKFLFFCTLQSVNRALKESTNFCLVNIMMENKKDNEILININNCIGRK